MASAIFISYRRSDAGGHAGRLFDRLRHWFDADALFYDLDGIDAGDAFPQHIENAVCAAKVVLVVIGPDWLDTLIERASTSAVDYVHEEVTLALAREASGDPALVIPVLVGGATMPSPEAFPPALLQSVGPLFGLARPFALDTWTPEQSADFMANHLPQAPRAELVTLAKDLGGLPLALDQAASYLDITGMLVAEYRRLLDGVNTAGAVLEEGRAATSYERSVLATLSIAFERLSLAARQLLRVCSFAAPEPIPERLFRETIDKLPEALATAARDTLAWNATVAELRRYGLANRVEIPGLVNGPAASVEQALILHRLTQLVTRARLATPEHDCRALQALLHAGCPTDAQLPLHWPRFAALAQHVLQLDRFVGPGWVERSLFSRLLDPIGNYLREGPALYADSVHVLEQAVDIFTRELGEEHPDTLTSMNNLASTLSRQGDVEGSLMFQERVLEARQRVLGEEHRDTLTSMGNLASTLLRQGEVAGALRLQERVLEACRRVLGEEHRNTLTSMNNLAHTLRATGARKEAFALLQATAEGLARTLGANSSETLAVFTTLSRWRMQKRGYGIASYPQRAANNLGAIIGCIWLRSFP